MANTHHRSTTGPAVDLPRRLRLETAALHREVEAETGLPGSIRSVEGYVRLLDRTLTFHAIVMRALADPRWASQWTPVGVELGMHDRTAALRADLAELGFVREPDTARPLDISSFGEALGCLYVVEGSALGGQLLWPAIRDQIGPVPLSFFSGEGREHPVPWRATQAALRAYESHDHDTRPVLAGAVTTFHAYRDLVALDLLTRHTGAQT